MKPGEQHDPETDIAVLPTAKLSLAALAELLQRVKAGEDATRVRVELLTREGKAVASR